ncbi:peptidylprolyl isomerase [Pseudohongiella nitratireducens]|uniref:Periplasmic chaperone PpiD n=1 Tax=Pseudohongiella nitratireducens TaxID=1768907 RepID=A0A916QJR0_9GAMM|nr:SurA N-terminal domain-containing protein [Pseudohongiella nitratireducens]MDF1622747.1 SurA N-terminal domain-containing protein [Pseudohongiella nitratireducens]GFZ76518.1 peptidylprolyl isomerase [Pseudohongiella nitratireducens]
MLQTIRDNSQGVIAKVIIGFIIGVFALFGAESIVGGFLQGNEVASVNGEEITEQELSVGIQNVMASIGSDLGSIDEELIREVALNQLIEDKLLMQAAQDSGMVISADSIDREIIRNPQFQINGQFDNDLARRTMASQGFTPQGYREALADRMVLGQLANAYAASDFVTESDLERIAALQTQTRDFRYLTIPLGTRTVGEEISEEDLRAYYDENQAMFTVPEQVTVNYVLLDKDAIFEEIEIDEAQIRAQYEEEVGEAEADIEKRVSHILFDVSEGEDAAVAAAQQVKDRIDAGEAFEDLAAEVSVDTASGEAGGDIGYTDGTVFPDAVESALTSMEVGQVSDPVVSEFGVHLIKLTELDAADVPTFESAAERIERDLKQAEVDNVYFSRLETLANLAFETFDLQSISDELGMEVQVSETFGRNGGSSVVTSNQNVIDAAFSDEVLNQDLNSDSIELSDTQAVVVHLNEYQPEQVQPFDEVRNEIAVSLRTELERERTREIGQEILAALEAGEDVSDRIAAEGAEWEDRLNVQRNQFDMNTEIAENAFSMTEAEGGDVNREGFSLNNGSYSIIELAAVHPGSLSDLSEEQQEQLEGMLLESRGRDVFDALLAQLQQDGDISR